MILVEGQFGHGAVPDVKDARDYDINEIAFSTSPFDWTVGFDVEQTLNIKINTKNQGSSGSCGGQAWSYYDAVQNVAIQGGYNERSAKFIYAQTFVPGGGSEGRNNSDIIVKQGVSSEALCPSYQGDLSAPPTEAFMEQINDITPAAKLDAVKYEELSYTSCAIDIDTIAQNIRDYNGIVIGINGSNNGTWYSPYPQPPMTTEWSHWLYAGKAKLINGQKFIGVKNSWGDTVGEEGWQWLSADYITSQYIFNTWILIPKTVGPAPHYHFANVMKYGDNSIDVMQLQLALQKLGYFPANVNCTGTFLAITAKAVQTYQIANSITDFATVTDMTKIQVGPKTLVMLDK